jgi:sortase A
MKNRLWFKLSIFTLISSIIMIGFSLFQILSSREEVEQTISIWDNSNLAFSSANEPINTDIISTNIETEKKNTIGNSIDELGIIGKLSINNVGSPVPIIEGTTVSDLKRGAGHYIKSPLPGKEGNCLIFGHRDGIFRILKDIKLGDIILIETNEGTLHYQVIKTEILMPNDPEILRSYDKPVLTLVTCYPFSYIGPAPKRFIVTAKLMNNDN